MADRGVNRREFLIYAGGLSLAAGALTLPGCGSSPPRPTTPPPSATPTSTTTAAPPTAADWATLAQQLAGTLVLPTSPRYGEAKQLFNPRFDVRTPAGIVYCATPSDVQRTIAFARRHGIPFTARSGGHSYAGYSSGDGVVCDVTSMATVTVNPAGSAVVGAGARLIDVYSGVAAHGVAVPGGSCPSVGITGLALGGGVGVVGRKFGLTSDNLTRLQVVTAAGDLVSCDASTNTDLFWACRGGGGGNFGVVTSLTFSTYPVSQVTLFELRWPWPAAATVVAAWQGWIPGLPDELWSNCHVLSTGSPGQPGISVGGAFVGSQAALLPWLTPLRRAVGTAATSVSVGAHTYLDAMLAEAGCGGQDVAACHLAPQGSVQREASVGRSDIVLQPLSAAAITTIVDGVAARQANPQATTIAGVAFDSFGGAINRVAPDATAFVHRSALFGIQYNATWPTGANAGVVQSNVKGLDDLYTAMRPYASGFAYQNYIDPQLADWQHAYYGTNLPRLMTVKARYDPDNVFAFAQSIPVG